MKQEARRHGIAQHKIGTPVPCRAMGLPCGAKPMCEDYCFTSETIVRESNTVKRATLQLKANHAHTNHTIIKQQSMKKMRHNDLHGSTKLPTSTEKDYVNYFLTSCYALQFLGF